MKRPTRLGTDDAGRVINQTSRDNIQPEFEPILSAAIGFVKEAFGERLHSIYVYGSIGRGTAIVGQSDLDLTVITRDEVDLSELRERTNHLLSVHPEVSKIDYDIGRLETVLDPVNRFEWGFWLRHLCACVYGEDLSHRFPQMRPDDRVSEALNQDFSMRIETAQEQLINGDMTLFEKRSIVKRIIRGWYLTINVQDESFATMIEENLAILRLYFPDDERIDELAELLRLETISDEQLHNILHQTDWK